MTTCDTMPTRPIAPVRRASALLTGIVSTLACGQPAHADWVRVSSSQQSVFYVDSQKSISCGFVGRTR